MVFFPCSRSLVDEYRALGRDIVIAAEITCWPNAILCKTCADRYEFNSSDFIACEAFPYLNTGGYMGTAAALSEAFDWMRRQGAAIGHDDQENAWHYYNTFPSKVALDHRQRIWSTMLYCDPTRFRVENCSVFSEYVDDDVCFGHGNGGAKRDVLEPILHQLEEQGCRARPLEKMVSLY